jgi:hypothetical protein
MLPSAPGALLGLALSEAVDHVVEPLGQGFIPECPIHGPKPFTEMVAILAAEACCLGFWNRAGQRWRDPV